MMIRVAKIQSVLPRERWGHVKGTENPADCSSRGILPSELPSRSLWWSGPAWLLTVESSKLRPQEEQHTTNLEAKGIKVHVAPVEREVPLSFISKLSSWTKLLRVTAYCLRFTHNYSKSAREGAVPKWHGPLGAEELREAERRILRYHQQQVFGQ